MLMRLSRASKGINARLVEPQLAVGKEKQIFSTGWGGTGLELEAIRRGELNALETDAFRFSGVGALNR